MGKKPFYGSALATIRRSIPSERDSTIKPMDSFDLRDTIIPFSLLQITNHFKQMKPGEIFEVIVSDESIVRDLKSILPELEYELVHMENLDEDHPDFLIRLKRKQSLQSKGGIHG